MTRLLKLPALPLLSLSLIALTSGCATSDETPGPTARLVESGGERADSMTSDQFLTLTQSDTVYVQGGRMTGTANVTAVSEDGITVSSPMAVIRPASAERVAIDISSSGLVASWNSTMYFQLFVRGVSGGPWHPIEVSLPAVNADELLVRGLAATLSGNDAALDEMTVELSWRGSKAASYFDSVGWDFAAADFEGHSFYDQVVYQRTERSHIAVQPTAGEEIEIGVLAFPVSTRIGGLEGGHDFTVGARCDGQPCGTPRAECEGNLLRRFDAQGALIDERDCLAEEDLPCLDAEVDGLPSADCEPLCGPVLEGLSWCRDGLLESCQNRTYSVEECGTLERCIDDGYSAYCGII